MLEEKDLENIESIIDKKISEKLDHYFQNIVTKQDLENFDYKENDKHYATKYDVEELYQKLMFSIKDELNKFLLKIESLLHK